MKKFIFDSDFFEQDSKAVSFINDWYDLALHLGLSANKLSYAKMNRDQLQDKVVLRQGSETRTVYKSKGALAEIQHRLFPMMCGLIENTPNGQMLAYRKGVNATKIIADQVDKKYLIKFDIKKYYDHVSTRHIADMLKAQGFTKLGAQLISQFCVVSRGKVATLQQGSCVSPVISNLVGYEFIDKFVMAWIETYKKENPNVECTFYRYSDNIAVWLDSPNVGDITPAHLGSFKKHIIDSLGAVGLRTHKWAIVPNTHPKRNQKFLGVILNKIARIDKTKYAQWRATLFNSCKNGVEIAATNYWDHVGRGLWAEATPPNSYVPPADLRREVDTERFNMVLRGRNSYLGSISAKQQLELTKLYKAAMHLNAHHKQVYIPVMDCHINLSDIKEPHWDRTLVPCGNGVSAVSRSNRLIEAKMTILKQYKDSTEPLLDYIERLMMA